MTAGARDLDEEGLLTMLRGFSKGDQSLLEALVSISASELIPYVCLENPENAMETMIVNR